MRLSKEYTLCEVVLSLLSLLFPSYINELGVMAPSSLPCKLLIEGICGYNYCKEMYIQGSPKMKFSTLSFFTASQPHENQVFTSLQSFSLRRIECWGKDLEATVNRKLNMSPECDAGRQKPRLKQGAQSSFHRLRRLQGVLPDLPFTLGLQVPSQWSYPAGPTFPGARFFQPPNQMNAHTHTHTHTHSVSMMTELISTPKLTPYMSLDSMG
ncbi:uncharacterized protein LOC117870575 [Trachemys scripta elegans]|uniref:uncharacterized protein LOC117870575 n=1 Tax=Trachemys scripta elegans TaxID=31138 RepID=UPI0015517E33|nr:uncharacterized protein LOC117870575 [Trachemys scripta elegans]